MNRIPQGVFRAMAASAFGLLLAFTAANAAEPAPPYPPYPPPRYHRPPPRRVIGAPPPLSPVMRAIYAPFYAAGLVVRYGVYYVIVAPLEVFSRTVTYGAEGGVEPPPAPSRREGDT